MAAELARVPDVFAVHARQAWIEETKTPVEREAWYGIRLHPSTVDG